MKKRRQAQRSNIHTYIQLEWEVLIKTKQNFITELNIKNFSDIKADLPFLLKRSIFVPRKINLEGSSPKYIKVNLCLQNKTNKQTKKKKLSHLQKEEIGVNKNFFYEVFVQNFSCCLN